MSLRGLTTSQFVTAPKLARQALVRDVWIGANCTIFPGVTIGDNVIIGSNSVVNKNIPSNTVAFGSPARPHRAIEDDTGDAPSA